MITRATDAVASQVQKATVMGRVFWTAKSPTAPRKTRNRIAWMILMILRLDETPRVVGCIYRGDRRQSDPRGCARAENEGRQPRRRPASVGPGTLPRPWGVRLLPGVLVVGPIPLAMEAVRRVSRRLLLRAGTRAEIAGGAD